MDKGVSNTGLQNRASVYGKKQNLYVYFLGNPVNRTIMIPGVKVESGAKAVLVGEKEEVVRFTNKQNAVQVVLPKKFASSNVFLVKISGLQSE